MAASLSRMSSLYLENAMQDDADVEAGIQQEHDGRTPLDRTIDRIGMGPYQWTLLSLCGFGWLADNMWIQAIAIVLPRVQRHFDVSDSYIGTVSSSMFAGMMFGAIGWGTCSDLMGRTTAFNATLFLTAVFGVLASLASTFTWLCISLFFLGSAVGGSMPTDGTLLLEHMPNGKKYLVTVLSVFFSFGSVLAAVVGLLVIPGHSCSSAECDVAIENTGWKSLLMVLAIITLLMFTARILFFRLHESPRYLVHAGRPKEALESLQLISRFNGSELSLDLHDVRDTHGTLTTSAPHSAPQPVPARPDARRLFDDESPLRSPQGTPPGDEAKNYATGEAAAPLDADAVRHTRLSSFYEDEPYSSDPKDAESEAEPEPADEDDARLLPDHERAQATPRAPRPEEHSRRLSTASVRSVQEVRSRAYWVLPRSVRKPLFAWLDRIAMVLTPEWMRTTLLVWAAWCSMSLAYTMFNVYLPKLLEGRGSPIVAEAGPKDLRDSLWDVVIYSLGGCPGALLGAWLIESRLGRRWSLAGSTFVTAFFCWVFVIVEQPLAVTASTVGISLSATAMWAVLYGWTPEIFGTKVRGTACGIASALSRIGGMIAPMLGGSLLGINQSVPVYFSIVIFIVAGISVILIPEDENDSDKSRERVIVH